MEYIYFEPEDVTMFEDLGVDMDNLHLQIKLFDLKNDFTVQLERVETENDPEMNQVKWKGRAVYKINLLRVYYFFSEGMEISKFLSDTEM